MNPDFKELLLAFNAQGVEYLVVGAHALAVYGHVRATKYLNVWVRPDEENAERVLTALSAFGASLDDLTTDDLSKAGTVFQIGVPPLRIDLITRSMALTSRRHGRIVSVRALGECPFL